MALPEPPSVSASPQGSAVVGRDGDRTVVWLRGEHDMATTAELSVIFARAIAVGDADLVVDLSQVQFMDASTIGVIVSARSFLLPLSRLLSLQAPARCARRVLDVCGLTELIDPSSPELEAAGALGSWVAVAAIDRADHRAGRSAPAATTTATPGDSEEAAEGATVPAVRRGP